MNDKQWQELIDRHLRGELTEPEKEALAELLDSDPAARKEFVVEVQWDTLLTDALRDKMSDRSRRDEARTTISGRFPRRLSNRTVTNSLLAVAAVTIVALGISLYAERSQEREIATITGISGPVQWTGDGGRVVGDLTVGSELRGGTVEGLTPDSWADLEFNDGTVVTISGNSMLTFSDHSQKELHLRDGNVSANVKPQPPGKPMLVHTRSAMLEVLGTQFNVETGLGATMLNVSSGKVRVKRLSDGRTVDVPAQHRLVASAERELAPVLVPKSVDRWKSRVHLGPQSSLGKWSPKTDDEPAVLRAIPHTITTRQGKRLTLYVVAFPVSRGDDSPVILKSGSRAIVRGWVAKPRALFFGVTVRHANGEFAGNFQTVQPADDFAGEGDFELSLDFNQFELDPSLEQIKHKLPSRPDGLVVESFWCHSLNQPAGLGIAEVELIPPQQDPERQN